MEPDLIFQRIIQLCDVLIWPIITLIICILFRKPIINILYLIEGLKYGKFEVYFRKQLEKVAEGIQELPITKEKEKTWWNAEINQSLIEIAQKSPTAAILDAWRNIESDLIKLFNFKNNKYISLRMIYSKLLEEKMITENEYTLIKELRNLRNKVAHHSQATTISFDQALAYIENANKLHVYLKSRIEAKKREG